MSNFISIVSKAYTTNLIDEVADACKSVSTIDSNWNKAAGEVDLAKILSVVAKVFGTISLVCLGLSTFSIIQKRSASLSRLVYTATCFFGAAELLKAGNNLRFEYTMTAGEKAKERKAEKKGEWFSGTRATASHLWQRTKQAVRQEAEDFIINDPSRIEDFRLVRVVQVAVEDTYILGPLFRATVGA